MYPVDVKRDVVEVQRLARRLAAELCPDEVPLSEVGRLYGQVDRAVRALCVVRALLAPRLGASREWQRRGHRDAAEGLAARSGTSLRAARATMATGEALAGNERLRRAMADGELSADQGALVAEGARADPDATGGLIAAAKGGNLRDLRDAVGRVKAVADPDPDATHRRLHQARRLSRFTDSEGARHLDLHGPVDAVSVVEAELDRCLGRLIRSRPAGQQLESRDAMAFDAAVAMARRSAHAVGGSTDAATGATAPTGTGTPTASSTGATGATTSSSPWPSPTEAPSTAASARSPGSAPPPLLPLSPHDPPNAGRGLGIPGPGRRRRPGRGQSPPEHLALLRIDVEALWRGHVEGEELCEVTGLGPIPVAAARRLLGDAVLKLIITKGDAVAHVTSLTRGPTQAMRYALLWTSPTCCVEGCSRTITQHDHRWGAEFAKTGHTRLDELDRLCHTHHKLHTHHGWALVPGTGKRPIVAPTDPRHPGHAASGHAATGHAGPAPPGSSPRSVPRQGADTGGGHPQRSLFVPP